jgi:hypothetical protein
VTPRTHHVPDATDADARWDALVKQHEEATLLCSFWHHAQKVSPVIDELRSGGKDAIRALLRALDRDEDPAGMHVMTLLAEMTEQWPEHEAVTDDIAPGWSAIRVPDARAAWVRWGHEAGLIP